MTNRLRIEEIKHQQQQHLIKKQELQKLAQSGLSIESESDVKNINQSDGTAIKNEIQETNIDLSDKDQDHKKLSENQNTTGNLFISTKPSQGGDTNSLNNSHLIALKQNQENNNNTPNKLTNGQTNNSGKYS